MKKLIIIMLLLLVVSLMVSGCGFNGTQKLETNNSQQEVVQSGSSYAYVVVRLEFISEIRQLCEYQNPISKFENVEDRNLAIADCTFKNLSLINVDYGQIDDFNQEYCNGDLTGLSPEEIANIEEACNIIN